MGTAYTMSGGINISPPLNYTEIKTATKTALGMVRPQDKKYVTEHNVFTQFMPLGLMLNVFDKDTDEGPLTVTQGIALKPPNHDHFLPLSMGDFVRAMMKALPDHLWQGEVIALREDSMVAYKVEVNADSSLPVKVREIKGRAYLVWDDQPDEKILISDLV